MVVMNNETIMHFPVFIHKIHMGEELTLKGGSYAGVTQPYETTYPQDVRNCVKCHRNPAPRLRPREAVFNPHWRPTSDTPSGAELMAGYRIHPQTLTDCTVCHR